MEQRPLTCDDLLFVAFNGRVVAVHRHDGSIVWEWTEGAASNYVGLLPDGDMLFVSSRGYTWALDPATGATLWHQPFKGMGIGVPSLATMRGTSSGSSGAAAETERNEAAQRSASN